ncbi:hypothetical protein Tco_1272507 [Tanacetum coccineum]
METAKYGKIWYNEDALDLTSIETEFPAIVFDDSLTSNETLSCEPTVSSLNDEIDFRISFDKSNDEDYTVVFDKNSFSYKIISTNDLKTDSENDNEKVNMPLFSLPKPSVSCIDDLDFFKDFENEFPAIVYNDALTSKSDFSTEPTLCPQHIDEFDLNDETSLSEYDEVEQSVLYFNDLFPFNIVYLDDQKSDKGNDDNKIDMIQSLGVNENTNKLLEESHDKIIKVFIKGSLVMELNVTIVAWNYLVNECYSILLRIYIYRLTFRSTLNGIIRMVVVHECCGGQGFGREDEEVQEFMLEFFSTCRIGDEMRLDVAGTICFQLGGARRSMTWRQFILALGLHTAEEMAEDGFGAYWLGSERVVPDKGDLSDYWVVISSGRGFLRSAPSYAYIKDLVRRLCHRHTKGRKSGARLSKGHFIGRLAHHFGLVSDDGLRGLSVVASELPLIDMVDEGAQADPAPVHAPQPPPPPLAVGRTMT